MADISWKGPISAEPEPWAIECAHDLGLREGAVSDLWRRYLAHCKANHRRRTEQAIREAAREPHRRAFWCCAGAIDKNGNPLPLEPIEVRMGWRHFVEDELKAIKRWKGRRAKFQSRQQENRKKQAEYQCTLDKMAWWDRRDARLAAGDTAGMSWYEQHAERPRFLKRAKLNPHSAQEGRRYATAQQLAEKYVAEMIAGARLRKTREQIDDLWASTRGRRERLRLSPQLECELRTELERLGNLLPETAPRPSADRQEARQPAGDSADAKRSKPTGAAIRH